MAPVVLHAMRDAIVIAILLHGAQASDNGRAVTPPGGWRSWVRTQPQPPREGPATLSPLPARCHLT